MQYVRFSAWQNELLESEDENAAQGKAYWREQGLSSLPPVVTLPFEATPGGTQAAWATETLTRDIAPEVAAKIEASAEKYDTSVSVFLLACWQTLLWRLSGQSEIAASYVSDGREYEELQEAMGPFAKSLPIVCRFAGDARFGDVVKLIDRKVRDAREWQDYLTAEQGGDVGGTGLPVGFEFEERAPRRDVGGADIFNLQTINGSNASS